MTHSKRYNLAYRRQREGRTNYKLRLKLLISHIPRLVIRRTNTRTIIQVMSYTTEGDQVLVTASSSELASFGWSGAHNNTPACYLAGLLAGERIKAKGVAHVIADFGLQKSHHKGGLFAVLKGVVDAGVHVPVSPDCFPDEKRLSGAHIEAYAKSAKGHQFSKTKDAALSLSKLVSTVKEAIRKGAGAAAVKSKPKK
jgi:large subunit ribosomal protein L18